MRNCRPLLADRVDPALLARMAGSIAHRGPDDEGVWIDEEAGSASPTAACRSSICRRRAISRCTRPTAASSSATMAKSTITRELRARARGRGAVPEGGWRGHRDTETLVEAIAAWGLEAALGKSRRHVRLRAVGPARSGCSTWSATGSARSRFITAGSGGDFVFGSELKALRLHPALRPMRSTGDALRLFAARTYVPAPLSIYRGIFKLAAGLHPDRSRPTALRSRSAEPPPRRRAGRRLA